MLTRFTRLLVDRAKLAKSACEKVTPDHMCLPRGIHIKCPLKAPILERYV